MWLRRWAKAIGSTAGPWRNTTLLKSHKRIPPASDQGSTAILPKLPGIQRRSYRWRVPRNLPRLSTDLDCHVRKDPNVSVLTFQDSEVTLTTGGSRLGSYAGWLTLPAEDKLIILKRLWLPYKQCGAAPTSRHNKTPHISDEPKSLSSRFDLEEAIENLLNILGLVRFVENRLKCVLCLYRNIARD